MKIQQPDASTCAPYHPRDILSLLGSAPFPWWITGGWSIDLFLGKQSRDHFDVDIAISRDNQLLAQNHLNTWEFWASKRDKDDNIVLCKWETGHKLGTEYPGVWARESRASPWRFEFIFHEIQNQTWIFRFSDEIQHPIERVGGISSSDIPYHLPEISLLLKALRLRDVDKQDFQQVLPKLNQSQKLQLFEDIKKINPEHIWLSALV